VNLEELLRLALESWRRIKRPAEFNARICSQALERCKIHQAIGLE
jgi:hypothetical protein